MAADGDEQQIRVVALADHLHVPEQPGVAHVVEPESVLQLEDEPDRLAAHVRLVLVRRRVVPDQLRAVLGVHLGDADAGSERRHRAALVHPDGEVRGKLAESDERLAEPRRPVERRVVLLGERRGIAQVISVRVGHEQQIDLAQRVEVLVLRRRLRVLRQPRVDDDDLAARRGQPDRRLAEPEHLDLSGGFGLRLRRLRLCRERSAEQQRRDRAIEHESSEARPCSAPAQKAQRDWSFATSFATNARSPGGAAPGPLRRTRSPPTAPRPVPRGPAPAARRARGARA